MSDMQRVTKNMSFASDFAWVSRIDWMQQGYREGKRAHNLENLSNKMVDLTGAKENNDLSPGKKGLTG